MNCYEDCYEDCLIVLAQALRAGNLSLESYAFGFRALEAYQFGSDSDEDCEDSD